MREEWKTELHELTVILKQVYEPRPDGNALFSRRFICKLNGASWKTTQPLGVGIPAKIKNPTLCLPGT